MALDAGDHIWYWTGSGISDEQVSTDQNIPRLTWFPGASPTDPNDYQGHGVDIYNFVVYDGEIRRGQPHLRSGNGSFAWLNNNPGNLTGQPGGPDFGQFAGKFNWHNFLVFPDHDTGFAAIGSFLRQGPYPNLSILAAFQKYAPASDGNRPDQYAASVASAAGVTVDTPLNQLNDDQMQQMQAEIEQIEGTVAGDSFDPGSSDLPAAVQQLIGDDNGTDDDTGTETDDDNGTDDDTD
jgi:hypothetical protein